MQPERKNLWPVVGASALIGLVLAIVLGMIFSEHAVVVGLTTFAIVGMVVGLGYSIYESSQAKKAHRDQYTQHK